MKIHSVLGSGFREVVYKDALELELLRAGIKYKREAGFAIHYEERLLPHMFIADFIAYERILLEIKSTTQIQYQHFGQTYNYLKASKIKLGLLINFGEDRLNYKRIVCG